jgi:sensor domain CHASE-containing protein
MSLQYKTLAIVSGILAGLVVIMFITARLILLGSFEQLERQSVQQNLQRLRSVIADEIDALSATNADYAHWDDSYAFVQDANEDYILVNTADESLINLQLNAMIFVNNSGRIVFGKAMDLINGQEQPLPQDLEMLLSANSPLLNLPDENSSTAGIVVTNEGPIIVTSRPILTSLKEGPIQGALIFGRYLDMSQIQAISESLGLSIKAYQVNDPDMPDDFVTAATSLSENASTFIDVLANERVAGYTLLEDLYGNPAVVLRIDLPRDIYNQGQTSISFFAVALTVVGLVFTTATLLLLRQVVLSPLAQLSADIDSISTQSDISKRLDISGGSNDELNQLGNALNAMLNALETAQKKLRKSDERLRVVVNNAPIVLWAVDAERLFTTLEGNGLKALDIQPDLFLGKNAFEFHGALPLVEAEVQRASSGEELTSLVAVNDRTFATRYSPLCDEHNVIIGVIGVATDVTERVQAQQAFQAANAHLEQQNRQLERVHELFRSALNQITEITQRGADKTELLDNLRIIHAEFQRLD